MTNYRPCVPDDLDTLTGLLCHAFGGDAEDVQKWIRMAGFEHYRLFGAKFDGCLLEVPMGMFIASRSVPLVGVAGVGVAPQARGRGVATEMMSTFVRDLHARKVPLTALYASTQGLYRKVGYERAGYRCLHQLSPKDIHIRDTSLDVVPLGEGPPPEGVVECHRAAWLHQTGQLDRGPYCWTRVHRPGDKSARGFAVTSEDGIEGYLYMRQSRDEHGFHVIHLSDVAARTPRAGRVLLSFLRDHATLTPWIKMGGGPSHPVLMLLGESRFESSVIDEHWMLRIVDVAGALEARGWSPGIEAEIHFEVSDDIVDDNNARFVFRLSDRTASVDRGGDGTARIDIRALASLYTGYSTATELHALGRFDAPTEVVSLTDPVFAGPTPWMTDMF